MTRRVLEQRIPIQVLSDELVKGTNCNLVDHRPCLSALDQTYLTYGSFGGQVLFKASIAAPILKQAFAKVLSELPWFAGRLYVRKDGRTYDVTCNNAGGRIIFASTSANLDQVAEALLPTSNPAGGAFDPAMKYALPHDVDAVVKGKLPLCLVYLLHLSGGGALLAVTVSHCLVDFTGLQTFVDHMATAYNTALALAPARDAAGRTGGWEQDRQLAAKSTIRITSSSTGVVNVAASTPATRAANSNSTASNVADSSKPSAPEPTPFGTGTGAVAESIAACSGLPPPRLPAHRPGPRPGFYAPEAVDRMAEAEAAPPPPPLVGARRWPSVAAVPAWRLPLVLLHIISQMMLRGGGVEGRYLWVSAPHLADLKRRAMEELLKTATTAATAAAPAALATAAATTTGYGSAVSPAPPSGSTATPASMAPAAAGVDTGTTDSSPDTRPSAWVSTRDCLAARLAQLLHSVPLKNHPAWQFFIVANLRPRAVPRLPDGQLGNWVWGARVDEVAPCRMGLGELAARVRAALDSLPTMLGAHVRTVRKLVESCPPRQVMNEVILEADPARCLLAPEGPIAINNWQLEYDIWQFGPAPPLIFKPSLPPGIIPNVLTTFAAPSDSTLGSTLGSTRPDGTRLGSSSRPDGPDRGLVLHVCLHRSVWRQLDAATGGDLAAAL